MDRFRWMMPRPPWRAMATAILASVTVSIGELSSGTLTQIRFETREEVSTSAGMISLWAGWSRTSSKVRPSVSNGARTPVAVRSEGNDNCGPFDVSMEITCYPAQVAPTGSLRLRSTRGIATRVAQRADPIKQPIPEWCAKCRSADRDQKSQNLQWPAPNAILLVRPGPPQREP